MTRVVLLGGGHSHIEVLRRLCSARLPAQVSVIDPCTVLPYSGMVPGFVAGLYTAAEISIDLARLCARAQVELRRTHAIALDCAARIVTCGDGSRLPYDVLSLDVGSTVDAGQPEHVLPVRPLYRFVDMWQRAGTKLARTSPRIAIVGGGAAGIELALAMHASLKRDSARPTLTLIESAPRLLPSYAAGARVRIERLCRDRDIAVRCAAAVTRMDADVVHLASGEAVQADLTIWATGPRAPSWLADSGLETDERGFVAVDAHLRSVSHADVFAAGDVASMIGHQRPKSGVYAVRQGPPLAENLRRTLEGRGLLAYRPQPRALALLGTGERRAVGTYGKLSFEGAWVWRWKDYIDRRFVSRYARAGGG